MDLIVYIVIAALAVGLLTWFFRKRQVDYYVENQNSVLEKENQKLDVELNTRTNELALARTEILELKTINNRFQESITKLTAEKSIAATTAERVPPLEQELKGLRGTIIELESKNLQLQTRLEEQVTAFEEKIDILNKAKETLTVEFENLGHKIFEEKAKTFTQQNKSNLEGLLNPFKQQISEFQKRINDVYDNDSKDRGALREQLINLLNMNQKLSTDANNLTRALKGDSKSQGNWGEVKERRAI